MLSQLYQMTGVALLSARACLLMSLLQASTSTNVQVGLTRLKIKALKQILKLLHINGNS